MKDLGFWVVGKAYFIRTVTMHQIGVLLDLNDKELLLKDAIWVADSGLFNHALRTGKLDEVEPFVGNIIVNRDAIVDVCEWTHEIPKKSC
jgi:hypothetical protein